MVGYKKTKQFMKQKECREGKKEGGKEELRAKTERKMVVSKIK